jgi:hypothetical protein
MAIRNGIRLRLVPPTNPKQEFYRCLQKLITDIKYNLKQKWSEQCAALQGGGGGSSVERSNERSFKLNQD